MAAENVSGKLYKNKMAAITLVEKAKWRLKSVSYVLFRTSYHVMQRALLAIYKLPLPVFALSLVTYSMLAKFYVIAYAKYLAYETVMCSEPV